VAQEKKRPDTSLPPKCLSCAAIAGVLLLPRPAGGHERMPVAEPAISVGPQVSYNFASDGRKAVGYGADLAFLYTPVWGGGGFKLSHGDDVIVSPYVEAGFWFLINVGAGYALSFHGGETDHNVHLFIGEPIPLNWVAEEFSGETWLLMGEPYYRRTWRLNSDFRENEIGVLLKLVFDV
jgi:hypothetical protein